MICTIKWNIVTNSKQSKAYESINSCTLLQSHTYARTYERNRGYNVRYGVVEIDGKEAGTVTALEKYALNKILHVISVDRGPIWFDGFGTSEHFAAFIGEYNRQFPKRWGRKRRIIPEMQEDPSIDEIMRQAGFVKTAAPPYQTICVDLQKPLDQLHGELRKSWRQSLQKAQKANLGIEWHQDGTKLPWMLKHYQLDKQQRGYDGPDIAFLKPLCEAFAKEKKLLIGIAKLDNVPCAAILILMHGRSATYQIGWSTENGKQHCAHHLLLWEALAQLKAANVYDFDLGGVNDESASGIKTFKTGMGGKLVRLAGLYT